MGRPVHVIVSALIIAFLYLLHRPAPWHSGRRMLRQLRWFFVSLLVLFFWFTPGDPVFYAAADWSRWLPTREGLAEGVLRVTALAVIVLAVNLVLAITPQEQLFAGLLWLAAPVERLGADRKRFALRVTLVLGAVPNVQELLSDLRRTIAGDGTLGFTAFGEVAGRALDRILREADSAPLSPLVVQLGTAPPLWQWTLPAFLILGWWYVS